MASIRTFHHRDFSIATLCQKKAASGETVSVVIPTLDEQSTIGRIASVVREELMERYPLVDELIVVDSGSRDQTVAAARSAGATVYQASAIQPELGHYRGKGENLWKSQWVTSGSITVFVDGDIMNFHAGYISGLVGPLLEDATLHYVKGFYQRPLCSKLGDLEDEGGRVSELLIKPFFSLFYPELRALHQPLAGEYAVRRSMLAQLPFPTGYAVEVAHLIDVLASHGIAVLGQCDLESRRHRNRPLRDLSEMASGILPILLQRAERDGKLKLAEHLRDVWQQEPWLHGANETPASERRAISELLESPPIRS